MDDVRLLESFVRLLEYNPYHGADGKFTDEAGAKTTSGMPRRNVTRAANILKRTEEYGGSTTHEDRAGRTRAATSGIFVGDPKFGRGIPAGMPHEQAANEIARFVAANRHLLAQGREVGSWKDKAGNIHLDMPKRFKDIKKAARSGHKLGELEIIDLGTALKTGFEQGSYVTHGVGWADTMRSLGLVRKQPKIRGSKAGRVYRHREGLTILPSDAILWTLREGESPYDFARAILDHYRAA